MMDSLRKITQREFDALYLAGLDDARFHPVIASTRGFLVGSWLIHHGFLPDLSHLSLRNLNFRYADLENLVLNQTDVAGTVFSFADFTHVASLDLMPDQNTQFFQASFTPSQVERLPKITKTTHIRIAQQPRSKAVSTTANEVRLNTVTEKVKSRFLSDFSKIAAPLRGSQ
jgi:hypothetical protein